MSHRSFCSGAMAFGAQILVAALLGCAPAAVTDTGGDTATPGDAPGDPAAGDPVAGDPVAGDPVAGDPGAGDPGAGDPGAGDPVAGDPIAGDPTTCGSPLTPEFPWQVFQDWSSRLDTGGYTPTERQQIADLGFGIWAMERVLNDAGAAELRAIRALNPSLIITCVFSTLVVNANEPWSGRPLVHRVWEIFTAHRALHLDGEPIVSWPDPAQPTTSYWHSTLPASGGESYNRDLFDQLMTAIETAQAAYPDVACQGMWQDYYTTGGPYVWPASLSDHGAADLDQDGVAFAADAEEMASWLDWERDFSTELTARFGCGFIQFPNGRAVYPAASGADEALGRRVNGAIFEGFPDLPWYDRAETVWQLYQTYEVGWSVPNRGFRWNLLFLRPSASAADFQAARVASMVFQTPYFQAASGAAVNYEDAHGIVAGAATGDVAVATAGDVVTFTREYENGTAAIVIDRGTGAIQPTWTPN